MSSVAVPFFRPDFSGGEIDEVVATLKSGWLTTGPRVKISGRSASRQGSRAPWSFSTLCTDWGF